jgi:hypothetical protein
VESVEEDEEEDVDDVEELVPPTPDWASAFSMA